MTTIVTYVTMVTFISKAKAMVTVAVVFMWSYLSWLLNLSLIFSYYSYIADHGTMVNPLNAELNPICHLLALLGGATIVVVSRLRVNIVYFDERYPLDTTIYLLL